MKKYNREWTRINANKNSLIRIHSCSFAVSFALLLCLLPICSYAAEETVAISGTALDISAQAEVKVAPDIATISAGVITIAPTAGKALQQNTAKMSAVVKALAAAGIADKDIQTSDVSVEPQYAENPGNRPPRITAYQVNNTVTVTLRNLNNIGAVLDTLVEQGANQLNGPSFSVEDRSTALDQARKAAMEKAQKSAAVYAAAAGLKIKRIVSISEQGSFIPPRPRPMMMHAAMAMAAVAPETPVAPGEVTSEITINVEYELAP